MERPGTTEIEFRAISGWEKIPVRTHANAELTAPVACLPSNAIAILVFQLKWSTVISDKLFHLFSLIIYDKHIILCHRNRNGKESFARHAP